MKKFKLLPSILMLILCVGVLAVGIYAASPISHSVVGTVNISAGGANVSITGYLDDGDGDFSNDVKVTNTYTSRTTKTISIYANALDFDCSSASDIAQVAEKKLYFKVQNHSSFSLGAYFLEGTVPEGGTTESNIAKNKNFNGTMGTETISNLITATFTLYSEVPANSSTNMYSTLKLNQLNKEASTVTLSLNLNIEKFNEELVSAASNFVDVKNSNELNATINCSLENGFAQNNETALLQDKGIWNVGELSFSTDTIGESSDLRLKPIKMKILVTNKNSLPISANIVEGDNVQEQEDVMVTTIGCDYIAPNTTEEVSIQFIPIYTREEGITAPPEINDYSYSIVINTVQQVTDSEILSRVEYDETGLVETYHFYIPFGDNPYVAGENCAGLFGQKMMRLIQERQ